MSSSWVDSDLFYDDLLYEFNVNWNNNNLYIKTTKSKFKKFKKILSFSRV